MKFYYYVVIMVGIMILLNAAGMTTPTGGLVSTLNVINESGSPSLETFKSSDLWSGSTNSLTYLLLGLIAAGLVIGAIGGAPDIRYLTAALVFIISGFVVADMIFIYTQLVSYGITWISWVGLALIGSLLAGFFITVKSFWEGND